VRKAKAAAVAAAVLGGVSFLVFELGSRSEHHEKKGRPATGSLVDVLNTPPTFVAKRRPVTLTYDIVCELPADRPPTPLMLKTFCITQGTLHVRRVGEQTFDELPVTATRHRAIATVPAEYASGSGFEYYVEIQDEHGLAATLPEGGADAPARARVIPHWTTIRLDRHTFDQTRRPDAILLRGRWGKGRDRFGIENGFGVSAFDVTPQGSILVLDGLKHRVVEFKRGARPRTLPFRFAAAEGDLAVGADGVIYVLGLTTGLAVHAYTSGGRLLYATRVPGITASQVHVGPRGPIVHSYPSESWIPVGEDTSAFDHARQVREARPGETFPGGAEVSVRADDHLARYQLVGPHLGAWQLASVTGLGEVQLAQPYGAGLAVVTRFWTEKKTEFVFLALTPTGLAQSFAMDTAEAVESESLSRFRLHGKTLYQLRTSNSGLEIAAFSLR
jgi:hypothetical protein